MVLFMVLLVVIVAVSGVVAIIGGVNLFGAVVDVAAVADVAAAVVDVVLGNSNKKDGKDADDDKKPPSQTTAPAEIEIVVSLNF